MAIVYADDDYGRSAATELRRLAEGKKLCVPVFASLPLDTGSSAFATQASSIAHQVITIWLTSCPLHATSLLFGLSVLCQLCDLTITDVLTRPAHPSSSSDTSKQNNKSASKKKGITNYQTSTLSSKQLKKQNNKLKTNVRTSAYVLSFKFFCYHPPPYF